MTMKKVIGCLFCVALLVSSCGSYEAAGAYTGAQFGSIIGSAVGGITGGWRGSNVGQIAGMAGGAIVGAAVGKAAENRAQERSVRVGRHVERSSAADNGGGAADGYYDPQGRGDDRVMISGLSGPSGSSAAPQGRIEIVSATFLDDSRDGMLVRGEGGRVVMELRNTTQHPVYRVRPMVSEVTGNRHVYVSQNVLVECIQPQQTIRYTAMVKTDRRLRNGQVVLRVGLQYEGGEMSAHQRDFVVRTRR